MPTIINQFMPTRDTSKGNIVPAKVLANLLLDAMAMYENSYDFAAQLKDLETVQKKKAAARAADPGNAHADDYIYSVVDHFYTMTLYEAAVSVCKAPYKNLQVPVYLLMFGGWNDAEDWASKVTRRKIAPTKERLKWESDMQAIYDKYADPVKPEVKAKPRKGKP